MYIKTIDQNTVDSQQTSPAYVLTFIRWDNRDTRNNSDDPIKTRNPLVVYNDAISVQVSFSKSSLTPTMQAALVSGDINYATAVAPGDFVFVNMVNWETKAQEIRDRAILGEAINKVDDGFKGVFKIQTVTRNLITSENGIKSYNYMVTAAGFTELNTVITYNPVLQGEFANQAYGLYPALLGKQYAQQSLKAKDCGELIRDLYAILLGHSHREEPENVTKYGNSHYKLPTLVAQLLGVGKAKYINEAYNLITGIWSASSISSSSAPLSAGFNPGISVVGSSKSKNVFIASPELQGALQLAPQDWNNKTVSSILMSYLNSVINEMYVAYRVAPNSNKVMPTIIARQKPFTNPNFKFKGGKTVPTSKFMGLPRWRLQPELVRTCSFTKNEALRVNFVQVFTRNLAELNSSNLSKQIQDENFVIDQGDIQRNGLKSYIITSDLDFPTAESGRSPTDTQAKPWTELVADWVINMHLKESGTFQCVGIEDPIAVGDNLEFDGVVYHIESINHSFQINQAGVKTFGTTIAVSYGIDTRSDSKTLLYTEMEHTDRFTKGKEDYEYNRLLPGFSDSQDITGRTVGEETKETEQKAFQKPRKKRSK
jgi:hypothetical protein